MRDDYKELLLMSGYPGEDSMRKKAERVLGEEMAMTKKEFPEGFSAPSREKVRLYRKGGHVRGLNKEQTDLVLPHRRKGEYGSNKSMTAAQAMRKGGDVKVRTPKLSIQSMHEAEELRKGGRAHHRRHHEEEKRRGGHARYARGGHINYEKDMMGEHACAEPRKVRPEHQKGAFDASYGEYKEQGYRRGGRAHHKRYARGGSVNYESEMMGETARSRPREVHPRDMGFDASYGEYKEKGFRKGGHTMKRAMGGAAKVRKGMATKEGRIIRK